MNLNLLREVVFHPVSMCVGLCIGLRWEGRRGKGVSGVFIHMMCVLPAVISESDSDMEEDEAEKLAGNFLLIYMYTHTVLHVHVQVCTCTCYV